MKTNLQFAGRLLLLALTFVAPVYAQQQQAPSQQQANPAAGAASGMQDSSTTVAPIMGSRNSLSANQIIAILEDKPELVVEIKQLAADQAQAQAQGQGQAVQVQADSITDEMLYSQISSNEALRVSITDFLRARGYVSDTDIQRSAAAGRSASQSSGQTDGSDDDARPTSTNLTALSQIPGSNTPLGASNDATGLNSAALSSNPALATTRAQPAQPKPTREMDPHNTTDVPKVLHVPAPYNLNSMRDLYTQIPEDNTHLKRFGSEVFLSRTTATRTSAQDNPLDIPIGPDYVVGPGDSLSIDLWGGISQTLTRVIDREGRVSLPEAGAVSVAGLTLERAQALIGNTLRQQYRNAQVAVTVSRLRTVRVYVVGDVQRPGAYDISSLSTPLNALYAAGGPTSVGSLRTLQHLRGNTVIANIDLYDFLLHGIRNGDDRFQGGDTLMVPPAGPQVAISGAVKRPAIYEMKTGEPKGNTTLASLFEDAGGATVAAALNHITVERIDANRQRETLTLDLPANASPDKARAIISDFPVKDGDRIHVAPILPFSERAVYLEGHVVRPGRIAFADGMRLNDVLHTYQDLLPEPAAKGEIIRLVPPDLHAETIQFDVADALIGNSPIALEPFDTVRVLGRYEVDSPKVTIRGEVLRPGSFPLSTGMTAAQLVRMAGGFKRDALLTDADLTSYTIADGSSVLGQRSAVRIGDAVTRDDHNADVPLKPGDILTVHQITGWNDIGASVLIEGEAAHPGSYGFQQGERLSSVLRRAGGLRDTAYPTGAVLLRDQVRDLEEKSRAELIRQIETSSSAARLQPNLSGGDSSAALQLIQQQQDQVVKQLRTQPVSGRLVIHITADINSWAGTDADIEVRSGDVLSIPKRPGFVLVDGQVYNASAITFVPGKTARWYLERAGGASELANRKEIFVIRANGLVVGRHSDAGKVLSAKLEAGDVVVVPQKVIGASQFWRNLLITAQLASSVAITAAVAGL